MHPVVVMSTPVRSTTLSVALLRELAARTRALVVLAALVVTFTSTVALARGGHGGGGHSGGGHSGGHFGGGHVGSGHSAGGHFGTSHFGGSHFGGGYSTGGAAFHGNSGSLISRGHVSISGRAGTYINHPWGAHQFRYSYTGRRDPFGHVYVGPHRVTVAPHWGRGYWGWSGGTWLWIDGDWWVSPEYPDWIWIGPEWVWDGTQWVLRPGYWAPANP